MGELKGYYNDGRKYKPYEVIRDWDLNFNLGCVVKYVSRVGRKPGASDIDDLKKAQQYLQFEIEHLANLNKDEEVLYDE